MIDTLNLCFDYPDEATEIAAFEEIPKHFDNVPTITSFPDGRQTINGTIGRLKVFLNPYGVQIGKCSFAKWLLGSNLRTLQREDIQMGIEKLSDMFHLPMERARVTRLDFGNNLIMKNPPETYYKYLGALLFHERKEMDTTLYYYGANEKLVFYDKIKEQKNHREQIPGLFQNANVLRYEVKMGANIGTLLKTPKVIAKMLYDESFYINMWLYWRNSYYKIQKIKDLVSEGMGIVTTTRKMLDRLALLKAKEIGANALIDYINNLEKSGYVDPREARRMKQAVKDMDKTEATELSDNIKELNDRVDEATRYFR